MAAQPVPSSERMFCIYPAYINSKKTIAQGRRIPKTKACDNPTYNEIKDVCVAIGLKPIVESNKLYPRELHRGDAYARGRVRIDLKREDGSLVNEAYPDKKTLMLYLAEMIPKLKSRSSKAAESSGHSQQSSKSRRKKR